MKYLIVIFVIFCGTSLLGQYTFKEHYFQRNKEVNGATNYLELSGGYEANSDYLSNAFVSGFFAGDFLDEELKTTTQSRLQGSNTFGLGVQAGFTYKRAFDSFNAVFCVGQSLQSSNSFSRGLYNVYLFGNQPFAGNAVNLASTTVSIQSYRYYALGVEKKLGKDLMLGGKLKLFQGRFFYDADLSKGSLFTETDGSLITVNPELELSFVTETDRFNPGVGLDFYAVKRTKKSMVFFEIQDLGFINYKETKNYSVDSTYQFSGFNVESIFALDEEEFNVSRENINEIFGVEAVLKNRTRLTPARFTIGFQEIVSDLLLLEGYINYRLLPGYAPQMIIKPSFFVYKKLSLAPVINLGGLGRADLGLNLSYHESKFFATLDVLELENTFLPEKTSGRGMFLKTGLLF